MEQAAVKCHRVKMVREIPGYTPLLGQMKKISYLGFGKVTRWAAVDSLSQANVINITDTMYFNIRAPKRQICATKLFISPPVHITAKKRTEGWMVVLWRHWQDMEMEVVTKHLGIDRCKKVLLHAQTCGSFSSKVEWLNGHRKTAEWISPAERCKQSPGQGMGRASMGMQFYGTAYPTGLAWSHWRNLWRSWELDPVSVFSGQHFNHKPILLFAAPLSYHLPMNSKASRLILPGSCLLNSCKLLRGLFCAVKKPEERDGEWADALSWCSLPGKIYH